jgi:methylated-DNA-[protein]-cysteine S-methyltransferase
MAPMRADIEWALFSTALGACGIAWRGDVVIATRLPGPDPRETEAGLAARSGGGPGMPGAVVRRAIAAITALIDGARIDLSDIECDFSGLETFAVGVYRLTRGVPPGETRTYGAIAAALGGTHLARGVGQALGRNPLPIIVPCHRIVGARQELTGFSAPGGVDTKLKLLRIEGARFGEPGLFGDLPLALKPRR